MAPIKPVRNTTSSDHIHKAKVQKTSTDHASTRPRLQAINQDYSDLDEQIHQAAHIIGLPNNWNTIEEQEARADIIRHLVRARAEWVLRWILDKLKDEAEAGRGARGHPAAWQLLGWMIHVLPVSRSAPHLRDASLPTILERALFEQLEADSNASSAQSGSLAHASNASDSSDDSSKGTSPSRKRKRGAVDTASSSRARANSVGQNRLFHAVKAVISIVMALATTHESAHDTTQAELMKMVLRTDSAQASRILRFWLATVRELLVTLPAQPVSTPSLEKYLDLSLVSDIWELRNVDSKDEPGASADEFSTECLVPTLALLETLKSLRKQSAIQSFTIALDRALQTLDKLLARHLLAPSRAAFLADASTEATKPGSREATALAGNLEPLRAKLLQAAQIEDAGDALPAGFALLFNAVSHLLDLAIRASPSRSPKGRLAEKPWIQATFTSLAACAGCTLDAPPEFVIRETAVAALDGALRVLHVHNVNINSELLKTIFWYYGGVKYPERQEKRVHWSLIATLIELDSSVFVAEPKANAKSSQDSPTDLAEFLFERISSTEFTGSGFGNHGLQIQDNPQHGDSRTATEVICSTGRTTVLERIIVPLMTAFIRNRNLLGFLRRWDHQLVRSYRYDNRKALAERRDHIWEARALNKALSEVFEQSLTQGQIATLIEEHAIRMTELGNAMEAGSKENVNVKRFAGYKKAASSVVIIPAILQSVQTDETITMLRPHLKSLLLSYTTWVQDDRYSSHSRLSHSWLTLCQLLVKLWPIELHDSPSKQQTQVHPLIERALKDISTVPKERAGRRTDSSARAAAMLFLLNICNYLRTVPGSETVVRTSLEKITKSLSSDRLDGEDQCKVVELFCTYFVDLVGHLDATSCETSLSSILEKLSEFDYNTADTMSSSLSQSIINDGSATLKKTYYTTLVAALSRESEGRQHQMAVKAISYIHPGALSREQREAILDRAITLIGSKSIATTELISIATHLMEAPNATAKVSTDNDVVFDLAEKLHQYGKETPATLQLLRQLTRLVLGHMIPNQAQAQNKTFLKGFAEKLDVIATASKKCSAARLSILRATILAQKQTTLLDPLQYVELLKHCLTDGGSGDTASLLEILDAFNELPSFTLQALNIYDTTRAWLRIWVNDNSELESYMASSNQSPVEVAKYVARLHTTIAKYKLYPNVKYLVNLTLRIVREPLTDGVKTTIHEAVKDALTLLPFWEQLDLMPVLAQVVDPVNRATSHRILSDLVATLHDKVESNAELKQRQLALLPGLCALLAKSPDYECFNALMNSINTILNEKPALASQYSIECVLSVLVKLTSRSSPVLSVEHASDIYSRLCETSRLILLVHRGRLGGRFHILLPLLQGLLFCLFIPNISRSGALPAWLRTVTLTDPIRLTSTNATQLSRLLSTLCNPPQSSITKAHQHHASRKSKDLNDPVRAARDKAGHFLYPFLASFCRFQLSGRLDAGVREKLMPGIWEVVGTAGLHKEALDAMFAGLGRSERDVWRNVWGGWEGVHRRRQVIGHGE